MALVSLDEAKEYLRVDTSDEDAVISMMISSASRLCADIARLTGEQWAVANGDADDPGHEVYAEDELAAVQDTLRIAILFAVGYLFEHREEGDHHGLNLLLRALLFSLREGVV